MWSGASARTRLQRPRVADGAARNTCVVIRCGESFLLRLPVQVRPRLPRRDSVSY